MALKDLKYGDSITTVSPALITDRPTASYLLLKMLQPDRKVFKCVYGGKEALYMSTRAELSGSVELDPNESFNYDKCGFVIFFSYVSQGNVTVNSSYSCHYAFMARMAHAAGATVKVTTVAQAIRAEAIESTSINCQQWEYDISADFERNGTHSVVTTKTKTPQEYMDNITVITAKGINGLFTSKAKLPAVTDDLKKKQEREMRELLERYSL